MSRLVLLALLALGLAGALPAADPPSVVLLGDSTVMEPSPTVPYQGWGPALRARLSPAMRVVNLARGGRSTKTCISEGLLAQAVKMRADYALIQFGHNDGHAKDKPESTDAATDYRGNLRTMVAELRAVGTRPVLVTPVHRCTFAADGTLTRELAPYAEAMRAVAEELRVPVVDLHIRSEAVLGALGRDGVVPALLASAEDRTHFSPAGSAVIAGLVATGLVEACPEFAAWVVTP